jgi:hypothetical protein
MLNTTVLSGGNGGIHPVAFRNGGSDECRQADACRIDVSGNMNEFVRFEVFTAVTMKNGVFWDVTPCGSCKNRRFGGT